MEQETEEIKQEDSPEIPEEPREKYVERPRWQVLGARIALVVFIIMVIVYYLNIAGGGR